MSVLGNYIYDTANNLATATVKGGQVDSLTSLPLGVTSGGTVYQKVGGLGTDGAFPTTAVSPAVTPHFKALGASVSQVIPIGAKGYMATFVTGTGTIGGEVATAGLTVSSSNTLAATVTVATDSASSAFVSWET